MLINIDINELVKNKLTADEFVLAELISEKNYEILNSYLDLYSREEYMGILDSLCKKRMIEGYSDHTDVKDITVRSIFTKILTKGDFFDELLQAFPSSVIRPDGTRDYLRTAPTKSRQKYSTITKNKLVIHEHILECLKYEIALRRKEGKLSYMQRIPNWLSTEGWKSYEDRLKDEGIDSLSNTDLGYGNQLE
jgi:hypothetical protein